MSKIISFGKYKGHTWRYLRYKPYWCRWFLGETNFQSQISEKCRSKCPELLEYVRNISFPIPEQNKHCFSNIGKYEIRCQGWDDEPTDNLRCNYNGFFYSPNEDNGGWLCKRCKKKKEIFNKYKRPPRVLQPPNNDLTDAISEITKSRMIEISNSDLIMTPEIREEFQKNIWDNCGICLGYFTPQEVFKNETDTIFLCNLCEKQVELCSKRRRY